MKDHHGKIKRTDEELDQLRQQVVVLEASAREFEETQRALRWLSETALELVGFPPEGDIYEFICTKVKQLVGDAIVGVNSIDEEEDVLRVRRVSGVAQAALGKVERLLGRNAVGASFEGVDKEAKRMLATGTLAEVEGGLYRTFFGRVPKPVCLAIEKLFGLAGIYSIGLRRKGRLFGNITILARKGARLNKYVLEAFASQASAALERRQAETELRESQQKFKTLAEESPNVIFIAKGYRVVYANRKCEEVVGYTREEVYAPDFDYRRIVAPECLDQLESRYRRRLEGEQIEPGEYTLVGKRGERIRAIVAVTLIDYEGEKAFLGIITDVSALKRSEEALREQRNRLRRLLEMHERERQLVAFEIHDGFIQPITAALMQLETHLRLLESEKPAASAESCHSAARLLRTGIADARRLMSGLRPAALDEFGVVAAVGSLVEQRRLDGQVEIEFDHSAAFGRLAPPLETALFRIIQEGLTNALRYSGSDKVRIGLAEAGEHIRVEVEDWGIGFDPASVAPNRFGLEGIRERARLFGGRAGIDSAPGRGTRITAELPMVEVEPPGAERAAGPPRQGS